MLKPANKKTGVKGFFSKYTLNEIHSFLCDISSFHQKKISPPPSFLISVYAPGPSSHNVHFQIMLQKIFALEK